MFLKLTSELWYGNILYISYNNDFEMLFSLILLRDLSKLKKRKRLNKIKILSVILFYLYKMYVKY
jgi:hypothetical protein